MIESIAHLGLLDDEEIELDIAALELSALDHPGVDLQPYFDLLDTLEEELRADGDDAETSEEQAGALSRLLSDRHGFVGDRESYDAPLNADMIRVLDRRRGLPVSLSILYVALARRLGWNAEALNTPSHVLVRLGPLDSPILIDPFHGGEPIGDETLERLLRQSVGPSAPIDPGHIAPLPNRLVLVRLLLNQATRAEQGGDIARAIAVYQRVVDVAPSYAQGWWDLARLQQGIGETDEARSSLSAMLEITRDAEARAKILETLGTLSGR
jgi:regulator of sirC expression with transglutaminase-like and TPR domain